MPRRQTVLQVLIASPKDVVEERASLEEIVREFNQSWSRNLDVRLELLRWETHAVPGFGTDPQDVVNRTLPDDYDIFIGIMWARFGTPTDRAGSGTVEEFERAYRRFQRAPESIRIMFYFKDEPIPPSRLDPIQLQAILNFKSQLGPRGGLYWSFNNLAEFQSYVRVHLTRLVQDWAAKAHHEPSVSSAVPDPPAGAAQPPAEETTHEEGFLDLIEAAQDSFTKLREVVGRMTHAVEQLGNSLRERSEELESLRQRGGQQDVKSAKRIVERSASDLEEYVNRTELEIPLFAEHLKQGIAAFGKAASITTDFGPDGTAQLSDALSATREFRVNTSAAKEHIAQFRATTVGMPRMTTAFNRAKRKTLETLDLLFREFDAAENLAEEVEKSIVALTLEAPTDS